MLWNQGPETNSRLAADAFVATGRHPATISRSRDGKGRTLPIYSEMRRWLLIEKNVRDAQFPQCRYVFRRGDKPVKNFVKSRIAACEAAGVPGLLLHDLRRAAVRNMVRAGVPGESGPASLGSQNALRL
jgi:integrase